MDRVDAANRPEVSEMAIDIALWWEPVSGFQEFRFSSKCRRDLLFVMCFVNYFWLVKESMMAIDFESAHGPLDPLLIRHFCTS